MIERISEINGMQSFARYSECEKYRYSLGRVWKKEGKRILFIGLNPSTADEIKNDPTITRMIGFSKKWGFSGMSVCNLFAFRATLPAVMKREEDPIGEFNEEILLNEIKNADLVIAAWGNHGTFLDRGSEVMGYLKKFSHFGFTKLGQPKHVLYLNSESCLFDEVMDEKEKF